MQPAILEERDGHVVILTLNRPKQRNIISSLEMVEAFESKVAAINADQEVRAVILTGSGNTFSSGGDVKEMAAPDGLHSQAPYEIRHWYVDGIQRIPKALYGLRVPLIAAVNGYAIGAGNDLACMCDVRIAAQSARFASSFAKVGIIPGDGGAFFLSRVVGYAKAAEMIFTGKMLNADDALACGLVTRVVPNEELMTEAKKLAQEIASNPAPVLRMGKMLLREAQTLSLDTVLELSACMQAIAHTTPEHLQAVTAIVERISKKKR
ncbi:MAG: crotonase/enoyl-CoA hydratase family protein [Ardenticatenaceae bacterium]